MGEGRTEGRGDVVMIARGRLQGSWGQTRDRGTPASPDPTAVTWGDAADPIHEDSLLRGSAQENGLAGANPAECGHFKDYRIQCHLSLPKNLSSVFPNPTSPKHVLES